MNNMLVYAAKERKSFSEASLNEIDSMIFSQLAYCNFDLLPQITKLTDLASDDEIKTLTQGNLGGKNTEKLIKIMIKNPRFKNVSWHQAISKVDAKTQMQFNAVTFMSLRASIMLLIVEQQRRLLDGKKTLICLLEIGCQLTILPVHIIEK